MNRVLSKLLDIIYPRVCPLCGGMSDRAGRHICWNCFSSLPFNTVDKPHCVRCGKVPDGDVAADFLCDACRLETPPFDLARTALPFHSAARDLIHILVIDDVMTTGATLGEIAATLKTAGTWRVWALAVARG